MSTEVTNQYLEMKVQTATPEALIVMLYEGAVRFLKQAANEMGEKDWHEAHKNIIKAQNIVSELSVSLDRSKGGEVADNLGRIYDYLNSRLIEANIKKDTRPISECIGLLNNLNASWMELSKSPKRVHETGVQLAG